MQVHIALDQSPVGVTRNYVSFIVRKCNVSQAGNVQSCPPVAQIAGEKAIDEVMMATLLDESCFRLSAS